MNRLRLRVSITSMMTPPYLEYVRFLFFSFLFHYDEVISDVKTTIIRERKKPCGIFRCLPSDLFFFFVNKEVYECRANDILFFSFHIGISTILYPTWRCQQCSKCSPAQPTSVHLCQPTADPSYCSCHPTTTTSTSTITASSSISSSCS